MGLPWAIRWRLWLASWRRFKPCVVEWPNMQVTDVVLKDCLTVYRPLKIPGVAGHCVDMGYDERGELVAVKIWSLVGKRR